MCRNHDGIMGVGEEPVPNEVKQTEALTNKAEEQQQNEKLKKAEDLIDNAIYRYASWLGGMLIAFFPAVAYPFYRYITTNETFGDCLFLVFCQSQIIFIAVSMCITASNDTISDCPDRYLKYWKLAIWVIIVLGALLFGFISISEITEETHSQERTLWINIALVISTVIVGSIPYIVSIIKACCEKKIITGKGGKK